MKGRPPTVERLAAIERELIALKGLIQQLLDNVRMASPKPYEPRFDQWPSNGR